MKTVLVDDATEGVLTASMTEPRPSGESEDTLIKSLNGYVVALTELKKTKRVEHLSHIFALLKLLPRGLRVLWLIGTPGHGLRERAAEIVFDDTRWAEYAREMGR